MKKLSRSRLIYGFYESSDKIDEERKISKWLRVLKYIIRDIIFFGYLMQFISFLEIHNIVFLRNFFNNCIKILNSPKKRKLVGTASLKLKYMP